MGSHTDSMTTEGTHVQPQVRRASYQDDLSAIQSSLHSVHVYSCLPASGEYVESFAGIVFREIVKKLAPRIFRSSRMQTIVCEISPPHTFSTYMCMCHWEGTVKRLHLC